MNPTSPEVLLRPRSRSLALTPRSARPASLVAAALALLALSGPARAQGNHAVFSRDGVDVWAVGDSGRYYRSLDGGATWGYGNLGSLALRGVGAFGRRVFVVGDSGRIWRSLDAGGTWTLTTVAGAPALRAVQVVDDFTVFVAGDGGTLLRTHDTGVSWTVLDAGTAGRLDVVRFGDARGGGVAGEGGFAARSADSGAVWTPAPTGTARELFDVDASGGVVWLVGARGTALRSGDGGSSFAPVKLGLDGVADVRGVHLAGPDTVVLAGGGGFVRRSTDGGSTWTFPPHALQGRVAALAFAGLSGWVVSERTRAVLRTADGGASWALPAGCTVTRSWTPKYTPVGLSVRGDTFRLNPFDPNTLYCLLNDRILASRDEGETWTPVGNPIPGCTQTNAFLISPRDSNLFLTASVFATAPQRRIMRSVDGGLTWTDQLEHAFGEYGVPLEMDPDHPDTVYFGGEADSLFRSTDFGQSWAPWGTKGFRSPCDLVVVPDSSAIMILGDGITGSGLGEIWRSTDRGQHWTLAWTNPGTGSEVPELACSRLANGRLFATNWGTGGVWRSTDYGATWDRVAATSSSWGVGVSGDDPGFVIYGRYSGGSSYLSLTGGALGSYDSSAALTFANYSFLPRDRGLVLAEQSNGIVKLGVSYAFTPSNAQSLALTSPVGGESWVAGTVHDITWNAAGVALARIEYRRSPADPWVAVAQIEGYAGRFAWTVPFDPTTQAQVRVSDFADGAPSSVSPSAFGIVSAPSWAAWPQPLECGTVAPGGAATALLTVADGGSATLHVSAVTSSSPRFTPDRTSFAVGAGGSDTLGVTFRPLALGPDSALVTFTTDDPAGPHAVLVRGTGSTATGVDGAPPVAFALLPPRPNPFRDATTLRYTLPRRARVTLEVFDLQGQRVATLVHAEQEPGVYGVPFHGDGSGGERGARAAGVYFVRLEAGSFQATRKLVLVR